MCLDIRYPKGKIQELPKEFVAYKVVMRKGIKYYPPIHGNHAIEKTNHLKVIGITERIKKGGSYKPYYHSFRTIAACKSVEAMQPGIFRYIKIKIKRKDVTCIGGQGKENKPPYYKVIVSRAFTTDFEEFNP